MIVHCVGNTGKLLPEEYLDSRGGYLRETEFPLTVSKTYVVYALALRQGQVWYYLLDDNELNYPVHYPAPLFRIVDNKLSDHWRFRFTPEHLDHLALFAFEEWVADPYFYDRLTDGIEQDVSLFWKMKDVIDSEFGVPNK